ncbi:MAG: hypothetical protein GF349_01095 [Candidatus Magasanikbacteria bacterium]|nr:hypothetical protein [Candidatus Magasanikbacteria bacterium]
MPEAVPQKNTGSEQVSPPPPPSPEQKADLEKTEQSPLEQGLEEMNEEEKQATLLSENNENELGTIKKDTEEIKKTVGGHNEKINDIDNRVTKLEAQNKRNIKGFLSKIKRVAGKATGKIFGRGESLRKETKTYRKMSKKDKAEFDNVVDQFHLGGYKGVYEYVNKNRGQMSEKLKKFLDDDWLNQVREAIPTETESTDKATGSEIDTEVDQPSSASSTTKEESEETSKTDAKIEPETETPKEDESEKETDAEPQPDTSEAEDKNDQPEPKEPEKKPEYAEMTGSEMRDLTASSVEDDIKDSMKKTIRDEYDENIDDKLLNKIIAQIATLDRSPEDLKNKEAVLDMYNEALENDDPEIRSQIVKIEEIIKSQGETTNKKISHDVRRLINKWIEDDKNDYFDDNDKIYEAYKQIKEGRNKIIEGKELNSLDIAKDEPVIIGDLNKYGFKILHSNHKAGQDAFAVSGDRKTFAVCDGMGSYGKSGVLAKQISHELVNLDMSLDEIFNTSNGRNKLYLILDKIKKSQEYKNANEREGKWTTRRDLESAFTTLTIVQKQTDGSWKFVVMGDSPLYIRNENGEYTGFGDETAGISLADHAFGIELGNTDIGFVENIHNIEYQPGRQICIATDFFSDNYLDFSDKDAKAENNSSGQVGNTANKRNFTREPMDFDKYKNPEDFVRTVTDPSLNKPDDATLILIDMDKHNEKNK